MPSFHDIFVAVRDALLSPGNILSFAAALVLLIFLYIIARFIFNLVEKRRQMTRVIRSTLSESLPESKHKKHFNIVQKKIVYDIITEFKRKEMVAATVPDSVYERYSEYLFGQIGRLDIDARVSEKLAPKIFPVVPGTVMELETVHLGELFVFERTALVVNERAIVIANIDSPRGVLTERRRLHVRYAAKNKFISGETKVLYFQPTGKAVIAYPKKLVVSDERRFVRMPLRNVRCRVTRLDTGDSYDGQIVDINIDGAKIRVPNSLRINRMYCIRFDAIVNSRTYSFDDLNCFISKTFFLKEGLFEYGMEFAYVDFKAHELLNSFLSALSKEHRVLDTKAS
jgi:hypothetical protein